MEQRRYFEQLDAIDPLLDLRALFDLRDDRVFFNGNSLGPPPRATADRLDEALRRWRDDMNAGWWDHQWLQLPTVTGDRIGALLGAAPGQVAVGESTSVNLFKLLCGAMELQTDARSVILTDRDNFPSDLYIADGVTRYVHRQATVRRVPTEEIGEHIDSDVAVVMLSHVDYRTAQLFPMREINERAHDAGALVLWDLSHSAGVVPLELDAAGTDLAVGCGYKYLNGGPGAPGYMYVAHRLLPRFEQPVTGWLGHTRPFDFTPGYAPDPGAARLTTGCPPLLSLLALDEGVQLTARADPAAVRAKSLALSEEFIALASERLAPYGVEVTGPTDTARRGSHVSLHSDSAERLAKGLAARGFHLELRPPDLLRFGLAPLYIRHVDVFDCVAAMEELLAEENTGHGGPRR